VAQLHDEHLTTEQLSAFFDKQLSAGEQAVFDAHLSTCQQCQQNLSDMRLTIALLRAMPEEEVPRSFVLPSRLAPVPERSVHQDRMVRPIPQKRHTWLDTLRRSVRTVSTIAAVLALFFIISGIIPSLHVGGGEAASSTTAAPASSSMGAQTNEPLTRTPKVHETTAVQAAQGTGTKIPTPIETPSPTPPTKVESNANTSTGPPPAEQGPTVPPELDPGQPVGRLSIGALLLVLSIIGLIFTRRRRAW